MEWTVTAINLQRDSIEVTEGPDWGMDENGQTWSTPGDTHRRFIPGVTSVTMTLALEGSPTSTMFRVNDRVSVSDA